MPFITLSSALAAPAPAVSLGAPLIEVGETLSSFKEDLVELLGRYSDTTTDEAWLNRRVNRGYQFTASILMSRLLNESFQMPVIAGQHAYNLPAGISYIRAASIVGSSDLDGGRYLIMTDEVGYRGFADLKDSPTRWLKSSRGSEGSGMLVLWPTPTSNATLNLEVRINPQPLIAEEHSPILPPPLHESILLAAQYRALRDLGQRAEAAIVNNDFLIQTRPLLDPDAEETSSYSKVSPVLSVRGLYGRRSDEP